MDALVDGFLAAGEDAQPEAVAAWVTIAAEAIRDDEVRQAYAAALHRFHDLFTRVVADGVDQGIFDTGELSNDECAAALLSTIQGYFNLAATARDIIPPGSAAPATRRMLRGLLAPRQVP